MEAVFSLIVAVALFIGFDLAATSFGADSRPGMSDDHARRTTAHHD